MGKEKVIWGGKRRKRGEEGKMKVFDSSSLSSRSKGNVHKGKKKWGGGGREKKKKNGRRRKKRAPPSLSYTI